MDSCGQNPRLTLPRSLLGVCMTMVSALFPPATDGEPLLGSQSAPSRYGQVVLSFPTARTFRQAFDLRSHALTLTIQNTQSQELQSLQSYDERLIRRVVMRDEGSQVHLTMILRDANLRVVVGEFREPYRINIDIFDYDYQLRRDPETGLPLALPTWRTEYWATAGGAPEGAGPPTPAQGPNEPEVDGSTTHEMAPSSPPMSHASRPEGRQLLQPVPDLFREPDELLQAVTATDPGVGRAWDTYPVYVYRIQTAVWDGGREPKDWERSAVAKAMSTAQTMADFGSRLFDFGHEGRALIAYQQVLHTDATIFEKSPLHLWKFAEIHLGQGNLMLADGYFQMLTEKHPEHILSRFAALRRLDIRAIQAQRDSATSDDWNEWARSARAIQAKDSAELRALIGIRQAYWAAPADLATRESSRLPPLASSLRGVLGGALEAVEGQKTAFLAASLMLYDMATSAPGGWQDSDTEFLRNYVKKFAGKGTEPMRTAVLAAVHQRISSTLEAHFAAQRHINVSRLASQLPEDIDQQIRSYTTLWAMAESERILARPEKALKVYARALQASTTASQRFRVEFWRSSIAAELDRASQGEASDASAKAASWRTLVRESDAGTWAAWNELTDDAKQVAYTEVKVPIERLATSSLLVRSAAQIVLSVWDQKLSTQVAAQSPQGQVAQETVTPGANAVQLLSALGAKFERLGMPTERRRSLSLLKEIKPSQVKDDRRALELWSKELVSLAEEYRKANLYLEAGRTYAFVGAENGNWEGRAEALYKGGLLLYRAGRREEAVAAFKQASEDGNNMFYANLARERLNQFEQ